MNVIAAVMPRGSRGNVQCLRRLHQAGMTPLPLNSELYQIPSSMTRPKDGPSSASGTKAREDMTALQGHVAFFDRDGDGIIWPLDTYVIVVTFEGERELILCFSASLASVPLDLAFFFQLWLYCSSTGDCRACYKLQLTYKLV